MRLAVPLIALTLTSAATAEPMPDAAAPGSLIAAPLAGPPDDLTCRDRIHQVRAERGLPQLQRETASPDEPLLIAAVDHRIGGCSVMVMYGNTSDVRPLPTMAYGPPRLQRIPAR